MPARKWTQCVCLVCGKTFGAKTSIRLYCGPGCLVAKKRSRRVELPSSTEYRIARDERNGRQTLELNGAVLSRGTGDVRERKPDCVRVLRCLGAMPAAFGLGVHLSCAACPIEESSSADLRESVGLNGSLRVLDQ